MRDVTDNDVALWIKVCAEVAAKGPYELNVPAEEIARRAACPTCWANGDTMAVGHDCGELDSKRGK